MSSRRMCIVALMAFPCGILFGQPAVPSGLDTLYRSNALFWQRIAEWERDTTRSAQIVMLGNSITQGGDWNALLGRPSVANRGIGSDNTAGFLARLQFVFALHPRVCFVMGGINDLYAGFPVETVFRNFTIIIDTLRAAGIVPVVQSTLYASPRWRKAAEKNLLVTLLNDSLKGYCQKEGVPYIDLNTHLSKEGILMEEYTTDGIHLSASAYRLWAGRLDAFLRQNDL